MFSVNKAHQISESSFGGKADFGDAGEIQSGDHTFCNVCSDSSKQMHPSGVYNEVEKSFKLLLNACDNYLLCDKINFLKN